MASVRFDRVSKVYPGGVTAVREASLEVRDKELMVLVGPSGCGKSTMLRMIAGLEEITSGDLYIGERRVNDVAPKDRDIAMVFQSYALYPHMSVRENMGFGLKLRKFPKHEIKSRVEEAARLLGLSEYLERKPKALSGGQRQRVALGRAIVRNPSVFLFDEPLSNLDAALRVQMRTEINALHRRLDATMVYVTHDQVEAMTMADRIAVVKDGVLQQVAEPLTLYNEPVNRFVASFIGSPAMNFLDGRLAGGRFDGTGFAAAPDSGLKAAVDHEGPAVLGVRPEDLELAGEVSGDGGPAEPGTLVMEVTLVEPMGHETFLHGKLGETLFLARVAPEPLPVAGRRYRLRMKPGSGHLFDASTGLSLLAGAAVSA